MRKQVITIQLSPVVLSKAWSWGKDNGLAKQVAIERLIMIGLSHLQQDKKGG